MDIDLKHQESEVEFQKKWEAGEMDEDWGDAQDAKRTPSGEEAGGIWCSACGSFPHYR